MDGVIRLTRESLTHPSMCQPVIAACAGDGICGSPLRRSTADVIHILRFWYAPLLLRGVIGSASACAYVAGMRSPVRSLPLHATTPQQDSHLIHRLLRLGVKQFASAQLTF